jgi:hypothetical protein
MMHIIINDFVRPVYNKGGKTLIYIGTNEGIIRVYKWIAQYYPEYMLDIGIFTSITSREDKLADKKNKKILLSTTKSAGKGEDIKGLKLTVLAAEPFKSKVLAQQTLGRTRDPNTFYIELVDLGFKKVREYYFSKLSTFNIYAESVSDSVFDKYELDKRVENIENRRANRGISPIILCDERYGIVPEEE